MSILERILADKREEVSRDMRRLPLAELKSHLTERNPDRAGCFRRALKAADSVALIGEIKKASPSRGLIREDFDPAWLAKEYVRGGAAALSVLTDRKYFQGAPEFLVQAREVSHLPVLRKDFMVTEYQLYESRLLGADCVLLIAAALEDQELESFIALCNELALDALVEIHDRSELERAARCGAGIIGVNNRDLSTFEVSLEVSQRLAPYFPPGMVRISESGISEHGHIELLGSLGYDAALVGEHLMRQADLALAARRLMQGAA